MTSPYSLPESEKLHIEYFGHLFNNTLELVVNRLYAKNLSENDFRERLPEIMLLVYQSAKSAGFREWKCR